MPDQAATAIIVASSQVMANADLELAGVAPLTGTASFTSSATADYAGTQAHMYVSAVVGAFPTAAWRAQAVIEGSSTFTTWVILLGAGTLAGSGGITASPVRVLETSGSLEGAGSITAAPRQTVIVGAQVVGAGTLSDDLLITAAGVLAGAGSLSGTTVQALAARPLPLVGRGTLGDSLPLPMVGYGFLTASYQLIQVPAPYCPRPVVPTFRYGYTLGRGDLELHLCDTSGNPFAPVVVLYAFYQVVAGGQRMLVGPPNRRPAADTSEGKVGRYYATGTAGELGQPGDWVCVWRYQRSWWTPTECVEQPFKVVDEVTSGDPHALSGRCIKYGWL